MTEERQAPEQAPKEAFMLAMHLSLLMLGIVVLISAAAVAIWSPGPEGQQLRIVRRLMSGGAANL